MSDEHQQLQEIRALLRHGTHGAPDEDLTFVAWHQGRRRARTRAWSVGTLAAAASTAVFVTALSLGGGDVPIHLPADDAARTSSPPLRMADYRIVFEVVVGSPADDGTVTSWEELAGLELDPVELTVDTSHGTSSAAHPGRLALGGRVTLGADHSLIVDDGCATQTFPGTDVVESRIVAGTPTVVEREEPECLYPSSLEPVDFLLRSPGTVPGQTATTDASGPVLAWEDGQLVVTGALPEQAVVPPPALPRSDGPSFIFLTRSAPTELEALPFLARDPEVVPAETESLLGSWFLVDQRGLEPSDEGPRMHFDGETWTVDLCGHTMSAPGDVVAGRIRLTEPWTVDRRPGAAPDPATASEDECPDLPWQDPAAWEDLFDEDPWVEREPAGDDRPEAILIDNSDRPEENER